MARQRLDGEALVVALWKDSGYHAFGCCAECGSDEYTCGVNPVSRVCLGCFEVVFDCRHPNMRRRKVLVAA